MYSQFMMHGQKKH